LINTEPNCSVTSGGRADLSAGKKRNKKTQRGAFLKEGRATIQE